MTDTVLEIVTTDVLTVDVVTLESLAFDPSATVLTAGEQGPAGPSGPPGPEGPPGLAASGLTFMQGTPDTTWVIDHNLGFKPAVEIIDQDGNEVDGEVSHLNINQLRIYFVTPLAGLARLH